MFLLKARKPEMCRETMDVNFSEKRHIIVDLLPVVKDEATGEAGPPFPRQYLVENLALASHGVRFTRCRRGSGGSRLTVRTALPDQGGLPWKHEMRREVFPIRDSVRPFLEHFHPVL